MLYQHPIVLLVLFVIACAIVIKQCVTKRQILKNRLFISFFFVFAMALCCLFYKDIKANETLYLVMNYIYLALDIVVAVFFFISVDYSMEKDNFYKEIVSSIDDSKIYVLVDKKDRVKQISNCFAEILGKTKNECIKKKLTNLIDDSLLIKAMNSEETSNSIIWNYYKNYKENVNESSKKNIEFIVEDRSACEFALAIIETPLFVMGKYQGRLWLGDKVSEENLIGMEKTIVDNNKQLDSLQARFVTLLDCAKEAIFFIDLDDESIWCNDLMVSMLNLEGNSLSLEEYKNFILRDDLPYYEAKMAHLSEREPNYDLTYRYNTGGRDIFIKEHGKLCVTKTGKEICGVIEYVPDSHYERTDIPELDLLKSEDQLLVEATKYENAGRPYLIAVFNLDDIPQINENHGRNFGNMVMGEYIRKFHKSFVNDNLIFRIGGLKFGAIITDLRKMEVLKHHLTQKDSVLHVHGSYGALSFDLNVTMGLAYHKDAGTAKGVYKGANDALKFAQRPQVNSSYVYYQDIK